MKITPPVVTLPLTATNGGTGQSSYAVGDLITANTTTTLARLADVAVNQVLTSGGVGAIPAWSATPTLTSLTLNGTLAMGANTITSTGVVNAGTFVGVTSATVPLMIGGTGGTSTLTLRSTSGAGAGGNDIIFQTGTNGSIEAMRINNSGNVSIGASTVGERLTIWSNGNPSVGWGDTSTLGRFTFSGTDPLVTALSGDLLLGTGTGTIRIRIQSSNGHVGIGGTATARLDVTVPANTIGFQVGGYSLTGASALSMFNASGTLNTSGVVDVWKLAITDTASGAGSNLIALYGGAAGATARFAVTNGGNVVLGSTTSLSLSGANNRVQVGPGTVPAKTGLAVNSVAAAAAEDGGVMLATTDNTLVYYASGNRYKVVGVAF